MDAWRGFDLAIEAVAGAARRGADIHLTIVGGGKGLERLKAKIRDLRMEHRVTLTGRVEMEEYQRLMGDADVVINPALKEGAVTVSFDSMAMGKPLICLDTTGYTRYFNNDYAVVIPRTGRDATIGRLADAMVELTDTARRRRMGMLARDAAKGISWEQHGIEIRDAIIRALHADGRSE